MGRLRLTRVHALIAAGLLVAVLALLVVSPAGLMMLSPAIALVLLIGLGLFPSEQLIARLRRMLRRPRRTPDLPGRRPADPGLRRTLSPLAFALAVRPPPRAPLSSLA